MAQCLVSLKALKGHTGEKVCEITTYCHNFGLNKVQIMLGFAVFIEQLAILQRTTNTRPTSQCGLLKTHDKIS
jgi:hypothetical protein